VKLIPVVALLAVACSSTPEASATYERGTLTGPPPAQRRPGVGLPTYTPHTARPGVEPQPKPQRALPQTPETQRQPGIWAANPPQDEPAIAFDWRVPVPDDDHEAATKIKACAKDMETASVKVLRRHDTDRLDNVAIVWRECWPHAVVAYCLSAERSALGPFPPTRAPDKRLAEVLDRAIKRARESFAEHCNAAPWRPGMEDLVLAAVRARGAK
jgi:hypothetical protein